MVRSERRAILAVAVVACLAPSVAPAQALPLAPGDAIAVQVYGRDDLSGDRVVDETGSVALPLLGPVAAEGLDPTALAAAIGASLDAAGLVTDAYVTVDVTRRRDVIVMGDVAAPGAVPWRPGLTVAQAVALAGGPARLSAGDLGAALQAISTRETASALSLDIATLTAREARIRAEIDLLRASFGTPLPPAGPTPPDATAPADPTAPSRAPIAPRRPVARAADRAVPTAAPTTTDAAPIPIAPLALDLAGLDLARWRGLLARDGGASLIAFADTVAADPDLAELRASERDLLVDRMTAAVADHDALLARRASLLATAEALRAQKVVADEAAARLGDLLATREDLRARNLASEGDVTSLQTAYANVLASGVQLLTSLAETEQTRLEVELALGAFAETRTAPLGVELADTARALAAARARRPAVDAAAEVAAAYGPDATLTPVEPVYRLRGAAAGAVDLDTALAPGATLEVDATP